MIICTCFGITDGEIRDAMRSDNPSMIAAGSCCGSCMPLISDIARKLKKDKRADAKAERPHPTGAHQHDR